MTAPDASLSRLLAKYAALASLRHARARGEPIPEKAVFKALADEFPGALHELDRLPMPEIEARRAALEQALSGGPVAPWMPAMALYHALYRAALYTKPRLPRKQALSAEQASALADSASRHAAVAVGAAFIRAVSAPPGGRIGAVVLAEVAARMAGEAGAPDAAPTGDTASSLLRAMFPTRRDLTTRAVERG